MFLITNRCIDETLKTVEAFGDTFNPKGPLELRVAEATRENGKWRIDFLPDVCTPQMLAAAGITPAADVAGNALPVYASRYVAQKLLLRLKARQKRIKSRAPALAFFVHGYNNNVAAVLDRARQFEELYGVEVVAFTWPSDGGGVAGVLSYKSDKRDALLSVGAFDRAIIKLDEYVKAMNADRVARIESEATRAHGNDAESWDETFARSMAQECPFTLNLILHSMGNYIFKHYLGSSTYSGQRLVFDNVVMAAADTNNEDHAGWVDRIQCRRRIYITINENDSALQASRMKAGEEQKARLGHWPYGLTSQRAVYVDFTQTEGVGDSHAYFEGDPVQTPGVKAFFRKALNGEAAERDLVYDVARNLYFVE